MTITNSGYNNKLHPLIRNLRQRSMDGGINDNSNNQRSGNATDGIAIVDKEQVLCKGCASSGKRIRSLNDPGCFDCMSNRLKLGVMSGDERMDGFIRRALDIPVKYVYEFLEWVPSEELNDIIFLARGGFGSVYKATWKKGRRLTWDERQLDFVREPDFEVAIKTLSHSTKLEELLQEVQTHQKLRSQGNVADCHGITRHPITGNFAMIMSLYKDGNLTFFMSQMQSTFTLERKLHYMWDISRALFKIHNVNLYHGDLHPGNIMIDNGHEPIICDLGLSGLDNSNNVKFGVVPYMAPEILRNELYNKKSDIYSLGILLWQIYTFCPPFFNMAHDNILVNEIVNGHRPPIPAGMPYWFQELLARCWHPEPNERPDAEDVQDCVFEYYDIITEQEEFYEDPPILTQSLHKNTSQHPLAVYHSRVFSFKNSSNTPANSKHQFTLEIIDFALDALS